jgi:hypothetical protein
MERFTKLIFLTILLASAALYFSSRVGEAAEAPRYVAVASYVNSPEMNATVGQRAHMILHAQKIESVAAGSAGMTISVPADRAAEALQLLAKAIKAENLPLTLIVLKGGRYVVVTPDRILEPKKPE